MGRGSRRELTSINSAALTADQEHAGWGVVELLIRIANADDAIIAIDELCARRAEDAEPLRVIRNGAVALFDRVRAGDRI